jgi:hypothetical protein
MDTNTATENTIKTHATETIVNVAPEQVVTNTSVQSPIIQSSRKSNRNIWVIVGIVIFLCLICVGCVAMVANNPDFKKALESATNSSSLPSVSYTSKANHTTQGDDKFSIQISNDYLCLPVQEDEGVTMLPCSHQTKDLRIAVVYESTTFNMSLDYYVNETKKTMNSENGYVEVNDEGRTKVSAYDAHKFSGKLDGNVDYDAYIITGNKAGYIVIVGYDKTSTTLDSDLKDAKEMMDTLVLK